MVFVDLADFSAARSSQNSTKCRIRAPSQIRAPLLKPGAISSQPSACVELGATKVMAVVSGPKEATNLGGTANFMIRDSNADGKLIISVHRTKFGGSGQASSALLDTTAKTAPIRMMVPGRKDEGQSSTLEELNLAEAVKRAVQPSVQLMKYRRSVIELSCAVIQDDGAGGLEIIILNFSPVLPALILACSLALVDARIELYDVVVAAELAVCQLHDTVLFDAAAAEAVIQNV